MAQPTYKDIVSRSISKVTGVKNPHVEFSAKLEFGDYTTNVMLKNHKNKIQEVVEKLSEDKNLKEIIEKIEVAGPGFINFHLSKKLLLSNLYRIIDEKQKYGCSTEEKGKTMVIDYSAPNIAKPFGIGHLRSTIIGQALYNLSKFIGYKVIGDNHLGDWGTQFGKLIYMIQERKLDPKKLSIDDLEKLYVEFHKLAEMDHFLEDKARDWFKKLEEGDKKAREIWQACVDISLVEFDRVYKLLGVRIDYAMGESFYEEEMKKMFEDEGIMRYVSAGEKGAKVINLESYGIKVPLMLVKSDGATTYAARDLATIKYRVEKWNPDVILYEVSVEQELHFRQVFAAARILGLVDDKVVLYHTKHGWYLGSDGKKFSTRKGKTVKLTDVLDEAIKRAEKYNNDKEIAKEVGIGAIKYYDLSRNIQTDVVFDWDKIFSLEGNSGPYIQYTYARIQSVLEKGGLSKTKDFVFEFEEEVILRQLAKFPEIILMAAKNYSPNILCEYLYNLASSYNTFYNKMRIIGSEKEQFRVLLTKGVGVVLKNGLDLLGISTPRKM